MDTQILDLFAKIKRDYPYELSYLIFTEGNWDCRKQIVICNNSEKYEISSYGEYFIVTLKQGCRDSLSVSDSEIKTQKEVLDIVFNKMVKGNIKKQKLDEINIMAKIYCERLFSRIDSIEHLLNYETDKNIISENLDNLGLEVNYIYSKMKVDVEWLYHSNGYEYHRYKMDTKLSVLEQLREVFRLLKEEKNKLLDKNNNLKEIKDKKDAKAVMSLLAQLCWSLEYHTL